MSTTDTTTLIRSYDGVELPTAGTFELDPSHSSATFVARHLMVTKVRGGFDGIAGSLELREDPLASQVAIAIDVRTVDTGDDGRDEHLRSADFFDADRHPEMTFRSSGVRHEGNGRFELDGDLTIRGTSVPVTLRGEVDGVVVDPWGNQRIAVSASTEIDREAWGLSWNQTLETGGLLVSKKIVVEIEAQFVRQG